MFDNLVPSDDEDNNDVILEVRAGISVLKWLIHNQCCNGYAIKRGLMFCLGTGGQEACLFTLEIFHMYQKYVKFQE